VLRDLLARTRSGMGIELEMCISSTVTGQQGPAAEGGGGGGFHGESSTCIAKTAVQEKCDHAGGSHLCLTG